MTGDASRVRIVELKCDAVALITLKNLGIDPASLTKALKKLVKSRKKLGSEVAADHSPALEDRIALINAFIK